MENTTEFTHNERSAKPSLSKNAFIYGLYTSLAMILMSLMFFALDMHLKTWPGYFSYVILIAGIVLAILNYRDRLNRGFISYSHGFQTGAIISAVVAVALAAYIYIYHTVINPEGVQQLLDLTQEKLAERGLSDDMIDQQIEMSAKFMKPGLMAIFSLIGQLIFGLIISLIVPLFLKKTDDSFSSTFPQQ